MDRCNLKVPYFFYTDHDTGGDNQKLYVNPRDLPFTGDSSGLDQIVNKQIKNPCQN